MPAKYMNAFSTWTRSNVTRHLFTWTNDPSEDVDFLDYVASHYFDPVNSGNLEIRNAVIDRSATPDTSMSWEVWRLSGGVWSLLHSKSVALDTGVIYLAYNQAVVAYDTSGHWESDEYGRPFDLNDLLA